ncbi:MAG TPA: hypothetical protein VHG91_09130 [Longimicrobium sp.]|nr:hypothetical protein [Longimicrobium sp.]
MRTARLALAALLATAAACDQPLELEAIDPTLCLQTSEFANYGCARVEGLVTDASSGASLEGVEIRLIPPADPARGAYDFAAAQTAADGTFLIEIRRTQRPSQLPSPDTVTMTLRASETIGNGVYTAEIPVLLRFRPVGERAIVFQQNLSLQLP